MTKKFSSLIKSSTFPQWAILLSLILIGGFNEFLSCFIAVVVSVFLIIKIAKNKSFDFHLNVTSVSIVVIFLGFLISSTYAIDSGMAFIGFLKFLPVPLYMLLIQQYENLKEKTFETLPLVALVLGAVSLVLMYIPATSEWFSVSDRLAGFFQYPNTFAMFLLVGELLILNKKKLSVIEIVGAVLLLGMIISTGSRTVFIIGILANLLMLFFRKGKKNKIAVGTIVLIVIIFSLVAIPLLKDYPFFERLFSFSISESTFAGRLLYYYDALPVILTHPFGLGYMGYYYIQQSIQTGVYSVMYIHNDFLQLLLDIGWVPFLALSVAVIKSIFSKGKTIGTRITLIAIVLHSLFDFDLQYTAMFFIFLLFLDYDTGKKITLKKGTPVIVTSVIICLLSAYFAIALSFAFWGDYETADKMYSANTRNKTALLINSEDVISQDEIADEILSRNQYVQVAYSAKAEYAYSDGDFEKLIEYKNKIFEIAPFSYDEYEEYCYMLIQGVTLYQEANDEESADYCLEELINTEEKLKDLNNRLSYFGKIIKDKPKTELPKEIEDYIKTAKKDIK